MVDFTAVLNLDALAEFKRASDATAPNTESDPAAARRHFTHGVRLFVLFAAGLMMTQSLRKSDLTSKSAHDSFTSLLSKGSTSKYFNAGTIASLFVGKSTKEMSGDMSIFTAAISGLIFFYSALLFGRQDLLDKLTKSRFMLSYIKEINFGGARCELLNQHNLTVRLKHTAGYIPNMGNISQVTHAMTPDEVGDAFSDFWSPYWNRDSLEEHVSDEPWENFHLILDDIPELDEMKVDLNDPSRWYKTIHKLKKNKASGYDGWTAEDLQLLPYHAVEHLCLICQRLWNEGFDHQFMQARTILLAKIDDVRHMGHCRPITILGQLYRLVTKIIADQILAFWAEHLPSDISGGIPGRGSRLLMYRHQARIEEAITTGSSVGGFVLDLVKAFNCIPRRPLACMHRHMGIPMVVVKFWMKSLRCLTRLPQIGQHLGQKVASTTGVPEGDALSVCGMICVAHHYHQYLTSFLDRVKVGIYADNWGWLTDCQKQNCLAMQRTLRFVHSIRMTIDFEKSWAWATNRDFKKSLLNLELLFPNGENKIHIVEDAKELGVRVRYNKRFKLGPIKDRFDSGRNSLFKIHWIPTTCDMKASLIYAVWQKIFYGLEGVGLGLTHFNRMRRAATTALIGNHKQASSWLTCCYLHRKILDPQFFALCEMLCLFRQLYTLEPEDARYILSIACKYIDQPPLQSWGPGSAMAVYLYRCNLTIDIDGIVEGCHHQKIDITKVSCREIKSFLETHWQYYVHSQVLHRKGVNDGCFFHRGIMTDVLRHFADADLKGLFLNITGGYQSGASKACVIKTLMNSALFAENLIRRNIAY